MAALRAVAYVHGPERIHELGRAFRDGCARHGVQCEIRHVNEARPDADVVWLYGLGPARPAFDAHAGAVRLVADKGYFAEYARGPRYFRVSMNAQQPDAHLQLRAHPSDRFDALRMTVAPVTRRGEYILLCGAGKRQNQIMGTQYGDWERRTFERLQAITDRPILFREKPKCPRIEGLPRAPEQRMSEAIRSAWAVVCFTGNVGVDAIVEGVPVIAESGPGAVYYPHALDAIETVEPLSPEARLAALSDIAYWQWTAAELAAGDFWKHLREEGIV